MNESREASELNGVIMNTTFEKSTHKYTLMATSGVAVLHHCDDVNHVILYWGLQSVELDHNEAQVKLHQGRGLQDSAGCLLRQSMK